MSIYIGNNNKVSCIKVSMKYRRKFSLRNWKFQRMKLMTSRFWLSLITERDISRQRNILFKTVKNSSFIISNRRTLFKNIIQKERYISIISITNITNINLSDATEERH